MEILGKITMKSVGAQPKPRSVTEKKDLVHIFGSCETFQEGSTTYGVFRKFKGRFEAVKLEDGEIFRSAWLLLPENAETLLTDQLVALGAVPGRVKTENDKGEEGKPSTEPVEFAFCIGVKPIFEKDGKTIVDRGQGYEYTIKPLIESRRRDSLSHLRELSERTRLGLPAPETETSTGTEAAAQGTVPEPEKATGTEGKPGHHPGRRK